MPRLTDLVMATQLDTKSQDAGLTLVRTELGLKHIDKAWDALLQLEKSQPSNASVQDLKGIVLMAKNQVVPARAAFHKAMTIDPTYFPACANLAQLELDDKHPEQARVELMRFWLAALLLTVSMHSLAASRVVSLSPALSEMMVEQHQR